MCTPIVILSEGHVSHVQRFFFLIQNSFFEKKLLLENCLQQSKRNIFIFFAQGKGMNINNPGVAYDI